MRDSYVGYSQIRRRGGAGAAFPVLFGVLLIAFYWVIWTQRIELSLHLFSGYVAAVLCYLATLVEVRVGLTLMLIAIGISPEIGSGSLSDMRIEDAIVPAVFFAWVTRLIVNREELYPTPLKGPIFGYLGVMLVATLNGLTFLDTPLRHASLHYLKTVEYFMIFLMVLNNVRSYDQARFFIAMMVVSAAITGAYGIFIARGLTSGQRLAGPPGEGANIIGGYYAFHIVLICALAASARGWLRRLLIVTALCVLGIPLLRTASRASVLALMTGLFLVTFINKGKVLVGALALFVLLPMIMPQEIVDRITTIFALLPGSNQVVPSSFTAKVGAWQDNLYTYVLSRPLLGAGMGRFTLAHVDNEYVKVLMEGGILALVFFLAILYRMLKMGMATYRATREPLYRGFSLGYVGAVASIASHAWAAASMTTIRTMEPLMFATGIMGAIYYREVVRPEEEARRRLSARPDGRAHVGHRRYRP